MVTAAAPARRSLIGALAAVRQARQGRPARVAAAAAKVREHVVTVAALAAVDVGAFHVPAGWGAAAGWVVTGVSLLVLDFAVTGR